MKEATRIKMEALEREEKEKRRARWAWARRPRLGEQKPISRIAMLSGAVFLVVVLAMGAGAEPFVKALLLIVGGAFAYLLPWLVADHRKHPATTSILIVNLFLGWTLLGWVAALAWAVSVPPPAPPAPPK